MYLRRVDVDMLNAVKSVLALLYWEWVREPLVTDGLLFWMHPFFYLVENLRWHKLKSDGPAPSARLDHAMCTVKLPSTTGIGLSTRFVTNTSVNVKVP